MSKNILITGATSGFGEATALLFAKNGYNTILLARRKDRLDSLKEKIVKFGVQAHTICADVRDKKAIFESIESLPKEFKNIENLYENIENVTAKKLKEKLIEGKMSAFMSKKLGTIVKDVPIE